MSPSLSPSLPLSCLVLPIFLLSSSILVRLGLLFRLLLPLWMRHNKSVLHLHALHFMSVEWTVGGGREGKGATLFLELCRIAVEPSSGLGCSAAAVPLAVAVPV